MKEKAQITTDALMLIKYSPGFLENNSDSFRAIKFPNSISVPSLKKRHRLPKIATDEQRWIGNDQI